uniref:C2H2-type domain-containing protein n=1 Tax=Plectus sambesii TaxID=2011161 RepID=A0A914VPI7_9BILA
MEVSSEFVGDPNLLAPIIYEDTGECSCQICGTILKNRKSFNKHRWQYHSVIRKTLGCPLTSVGCVEKMTNMTALRSHLLTKHGIECPEQILHFDDMRDFEAWKSEEEMASSSAFVRRTNAHTTKNDTQAQAYFYCNRSGNKDQRLKATATRKKGSGKIGAYCPAYLTVSINRIDGGVTVRACLTHVGHEMDAAYLPLPVPVVLTIERMLLDGRTVEDIVNTIKSSGDDSDAVLKINSSHVKYIKSRMGVVDAKEGDAPSTSAHPVEHPPQSLDTFAADAENDTFDSQLETWAYTLTAVRQTLDNIALHYRDADVTSLLANQPALDSLQRIASRIERAVVSSIDQSIATNRSKRPAPHQLRQPSKRKQLDRATKHSAVSCVVCEQRAFCRLKNTEETRKVLFAGCSEGIAKTISCVEVFKRQHKSELFQLNKVCFRRTEEYWEPEIQGVDRLKVNRDVPVIFILISRDSLPDNETVGRQKSTEPLPSWIWSQSKSVVKKKKKQPLTDTQQAANKWKRKTKKKGVPDSSAPTTAPLSKQM